MNRKQQSSGIFFGIFALSIQIAALKSTELLEIVLFGMTVCAFMILSAYLLLYKE